MMEFTYINGCNRCSCCRWYVATVPIADKIKATNKQQNAANTCSIQYYSYLKVLHAGYNKINSKQLNNNQMQPRLCDANL